jgi:hypothetical protein
MATTRRFPSRFFIMPSLRACGTPENLREPGVERPDLISRLDLSVCFFLVADPIVGGQVTSSWIINEHGPSKPESG